MRRAIGERSGGDGHARPRPCPRRAASRSRHLPELLALGLGSVACAALARRAGRPGGGWAPGSTGTRCSNRTSPPSGRRRLDTATLLQRFAGVPALHSFEAANCLLRPVAGGSPASRRARAICVSPDRRHLLVRRGARWRAPRGLRPPGRTARAWRVQPRRARGRTTRPSRYLPVVLPIGDDADGNLARSARPGRGAAGPWRGCAGALAVPPGRLSPAGPGPNDPGDRGSRRSQAPGRGCGRPVWSPGVVLFCGTPTALPSAVAARCAVVTMDPVAASDLSILVDRRAATLHPMGQVVRPHLQSAETAAHIAELVGPPTDDDPTPAPAPALAPACLLSLRADSSVAQQGRQRSGTDALAPGVIDVRLLTMTPRLDGLHEPLPPNRARRAVELVAYLALHEPMSSRATACARACSGRPTPMLPPRRCSTRRTRLAGPWGSTSRASPSFPPAPVTVSTKLSPQVTVDVDRAVALAAAGKAQSESCQRPSPTTAPRSTLVEGEPLANALSGYAWWEAEGHGGRIAAVLVDAACAMAPLAADGGFFDLGPLGTRASAHRGALQRGALPLRPCRWPRRKGTQTASAWSGGTASAASTRWTRAALPRRGPNPSTGSFPAVCSSAPRPRERTGQAGTGHRLGPPPPRRSAGRHPPGGPPGCPSPARHHSGPRHAGARPLRRPSPPAPAHRGKSGSRPPRSRATRPTAPPAGAHSRRRAPTRPSPREARASARQAGAAIERSAASVDAGLAL